jgi:hypothetical protein
LCGRRPDGREVHADRRRGSAAVDEQLEPRAHVLAVRVGDGRGEPAQERDEDAAVRLARLRLVEADLQLAIDALDERRCVDALAIQVDDGRRARAEIDDGAARGVPADRRAVERAARFLVPLVDEAELWTHGDLRFISVDGSRALRSPDLFPIRARWIGSSLGAGDLLVRGRPFLSDTAAEREGVVRRKQHRAAPREAALCRRCYDDP